MNHNAAMMEVWVADRRNILFVMGLLLCVILLWPVAGQAFKCNVTAGGIAFGGYDAFSPVPTTATADIGVTCNIKEKNKAAPLPVMISVSAGNSGSTAQRQLRHAAGGAVLNYNLYMDAGGGTIWGDGTGGSNSRIENVTKESPFNARIYGRIPALQNVPVGSYSDMITISILY